MSSRLPLPTRPGISGSSPLLTCVDCGEIACQTAPFAPFAAEFSAADSFLKAAEPHDAELDAATSHS
jgi:hypothetical protein